MNYSTNKPLSIKLTTLFLWAFFIILLFFAGFRWNVGIDWNTYMAALNPENIFFETLEPIVKGIVNIHWKYGLYDSGYTLFVMAFFTLFFYSYSFQLFSTAPVLSMILFVCLGPYFDSLNGVRQFVAIALFAFSWQFIFTRKPIPYFITILVATGFHASALFMLPVYFFIGYRFNRSFLIISFCAFIPLMFFANQIVSVLIRFVSIYSIYGNTRFLLSNPNPMALLRVVFPSIIFIFIILFYNKIKNDNIIIINLSIMYIYLTILFPSSQMMIRLAFYFQTAVLFMIPIISKQLSKSDAIIFNTFTVIYGILFIYITQLSRPFNKIIPFTLDFRLVNIKLLLLMLLCFLICFLFINVLKPNTKVRLTWKVSQ